ncbi:GNAT family N-acetyltransferase [Pseudomonas putida]|uniref:GNAT family N-acetyltransferase n=1 Tax=Pseudomonas TaxID=286 RepID=UPI00236464E7|nr:GNAT family N-acetyltransferase [Pseudomonas putida]MDD2076262.1 GNAT family N-acetyltransferase [Pseudomonas putida]HDS1694292.1 GNAT family N-acetyltransferase [Pseudomonas putida]
MKLTSKTICLRLIEEEDAAFVVQLRTDGKYNKYLSTVGDDVEAQRQWIKRYKEDEKAGDQFYFIIEQQNGTRCGTVRIYDLRPTSFSWGSWILNEDKTKYAAIESALLVYEFGFGHLGFGQAHFEVMKGNDKVVSFHKKMGAVEVGEDEVHTYFEISKAAVEQARQRLARIVG